MLKVILYVGGESEAGAAKLRLDTNPIDKTFIENVIKSNLE